MQVRFLKSWQQFTNKIQTFKMAFEVISSSFGQHAVITLKDSTTNTFAEIYNYGALLNNFTSQHHGTAINFIDGFSSPAEASEKITVFFKSAKLSPFACR